MFWAISNFRKCPQIKLDAAGDAKSGSYVHMSKNYYFLHFTFLYIFNRCFAVEMTHYINKTSVFLKMAKSPRYTICMYE